MLVRDVPELLVLHTLRLTGVAQPEVLRQRIRAADPELETELQRLAAAGLVDHHAGTLPGWSLTPAGREKAEAHLAAELDSLDARPLLEDAHARFVDLNRSVLAVCTDWQIVAGSDPMVLNDHRDPDYDRAVLDRLGDHHTEALELLDSVIAVLVRFATYPERLGAALARARAGGVDWVTKPMIDSYHTVWFELHEDLLATLGRRRAEDSDDERTEQGERT